MAQGALLIDEILKITDESHEDFVGWTALFVNDDTDQGIDKDRMIEQTAERWATAVSRFLATLTAPPTAAAAALASKGAAASAMKEGLSEGLPGLIELFTAFGAAIALAAGGPPIAIVAPFVLSPPPNPLTAAPVGPATTLSQDALNWLSQCKYTQTPPGTLTTAWF